MGYYINFSCVDGNFKPLSPLNKSIDLIKCGNAEEISKPHSFQDLPINKALLCGVNNSVFESIGLVYSEEEFKSFSDKTDKREKIWLLMDKKLAHNLSNYHEKEEEIIKWK
jgi:hypothetical protein